jgi:signal transduction histidine kinase/DNA-binding response OmpR family regulator/ligand-binding sensor domain-containing protein
MCNALILFAFLGNLIQTDSASPWPFQHVDNSSNLSNSAVTSVYMDRDDYVWLGTWDGLNRYDGSSISVYKPDPFVKGSISNNVIRNFLEDQQGNLWVVTHQGINRYNRTSNSFSVYLDSLNVPFLEYNIRASLGSDSAIWISVVGKGISRYSSNDDSFTAVKYRDINDSWLSSVVDIGHHNGLQYLLGGDGKLICAVNNQQVFSKKVSDKPFSFHQFVQLEQSYFLALGDGNKLLLYDLTEIENKPYEIKLGNILISSLSGNLDHTALWVGSESGDILKLTKSNGGFVVTLMNGYFPALSKARIKILTIKETKQNIVWVGTDGDGVYKFLTRPKTFYSVTEGPANEGHLSHKIVRAIFEDDDALLVGTRGGGLNIIDMVTNKTMVLNSSNGLSNNAVLSINKDHDNNIWVGLDGEGIDMIESGTGKIFHFPRDFENKNDLQFSSVYSICVDAFNDIWLGTSGYGVIRLKVSRVAGRASGRNKYTLKEYDQVANAGTASLNSIKSNIVYSIVEEKPNQLWFGTRGGGIYRYNALTKEIEAHIQASTNEKNSLNNNDILSLYIDQQEQLWVGSSGGLHRVFLQNRPYRIEHFSEHEGLPNNTIHGILEDEKANIWVSTNRGLVMYNRALAGFKNFDANDGLNNNEFADGAAFKSRTSNKLFFGGVDGLDIVFPEKLQKQNYFPRLAVSGFQVRSTPVVPGDDSKILDKHIDATADIALSYDQNFLSFSFTTLDYWNKQKSEYAYFLENFDKTWNYIGQQQSITLTNIPPGEYHLNINFTNENGEWGRVPRVLAITIAPPFWRTYWAYAFYVLLGIGVQVAIILYIRGRARTKKALAINKFKTQQLKELNDYKLQFFTNIAHEFRTPLTLILGPAASLLQTSNSQEQKQVKTIYSNSLRLQKLIDELIQFRKIESGKDVLELASLDLIPFTQEIVHTFQQHAADHNIQLEFHPEPDTMPACIDQKKVEKILINLISNAIKYTPSSGMVGIFVKEDDGKAVFIIKDDGIGIAQENSNKIFESFYHNHEELPGINGIETSAGIGLSLTRSLVQIHRGKIQLESEVGKGSTFTVTIPILAEHYNDLPAGNVLMLPAGHLSEKISMEFETDHYLGSHSVDEAGPAPDRNYSLLIVDDHASIVSLLDNMLSGKYFIHKARNGRRALEILENEKIDLVISDVIMPDMDGLRLCQTIKESIATSHIPVILLTAKGEIENRIEGLQVGADSYIPKPFHPEHLFIRVEKLIERVELTRRKFRDFANVELAQLSPGIGERDDSFFSKLTRCIETHMSATEFNADTMASEVGMSKATLYKKVKAITGLTPHGLIKQFRLKKAADLLKNSELSITEVIHETGFNSRSYFYKSFNEMFHCQPKDYLNSDKTGT